MNFPKFVMASDGTSTGVLLDGVFIGQGIERLDFSTEYNDRERKSTIRLMDLRIESVSMKHGEKEFLEFLGRISGHTDAQEGVS